MSKVSKDQDSHKMTLVLPVVMLLWSENYEKVTYGHKFLFEHFPLVLKILVYKEVVLEALIVVTFEYSSGIGSLFDFVDFNGNLGIFGSLLFLDLGVIANGGGDDRLEARIDSVLLFLHDLTGHAHGEFFVGLLDSGDFHADLTNFFLEVVLNVVISLRVMFD